MTVARLLAVFLVLAALIPASAGSTTPHHDMDISLDPERRDLTVTDRVRLEGGGRITFLLSANFVVTGFTVDGRTQGVARIGNRWHVDLGAFGMHSLVFSYRGRIKPLPPEPRPRHPVEAAAGAEGTFLPGSAEWYPHPRDKKFTYRVAVNLPEGQVAVVPGRMESESVADGRYRAAFVSEVPAFGIVLMAGPYHIEERDHAGIRLRTYFPPALASLATDYLDFTGRYIDLYRNWIGPYPFSAFHVVAGPYPVGFGYPGMTYMGERVLRLPFIRYTSLGHEVLHNWWGNGIEADHTAGNWSEGLTTFMADYTFGAKRSAAKGRDMRLGWLRDYAALPAERDRPAVEFVFKEHDAAQVIGYHKVAFFFHMLRNNLGSDTFDDGIRRFWKKHRLGVAAWPDIRNSFEAASGRDLSTFFDQWLRRAGAPRLHLSEVDVRSENGRHRVAFTLTQDPPVYALEVPVVVTTTTGSQRFALGLDGPSARRKLYTDAPPLALAIDPDFDVFRRLDPSEAPPILRDVTLNSTTATVILAGPGEAEAAARRLATRLLDSPPNWAPPAADLLPPAPLLLVGTTDRVGRFLGDAALPPVPTALDGRGTARAWASRHENRALLVVEADDVAGLEALLRPLPHYGRKGYLVFEGRKAVEHGTWPAADGPLRVRLPAHQ
jgi:aminopeptidase N